jgi:coenzyme F420-0:L-glutamate ligase/coenzyme F420-1:gamma-L-glutamate ligase
VTDVVEIQDPAERSRIAEAVLRDLPEWFGIEESTRQYIEDAATLPTLVVEPDAGFLCLKQHTPRAAEIYVMGVRREQHRKGIGRALVAAAESWCRVRGIPYLHVKTLGPSRPDPGGYDATRAFYEAVGFVALEELHGLWDEDNPTLVLVKNVRPGFAVTPVEGLPELREGDDLAALISERTELADGDVVVVAQKAVSKVEGRVVALADIEPSEQARELAGDEADPRRIQVILDEATELVRVRPPLLIARTRHGYVCGSAGVDASNAPEPETVVLLPVDPDASAAQLREALRERTGVEVGVIVTDSFGRPWRAATTDVAIGAAGVEVVRDLMGERDPNGYELHATRIAVADEIAGAAQLVFGKLDRVPVAVVRGLDVRGDGRGADIVIPPETDLFR